MHFLIAFIAMSVHAEHSFESEWHENKALSKKYYIERVPQQNFNGVHTACRTQGGIVPEPRTIQENEYLKRLAAGKAFFIGLSDEKEERRWRWRSDDSLPTYDLDFSIENGGKGGNCVLFMNQGLIEWDCNNSNFVSWVFCEKCMDGYFGVMCTNECHCKDPCKRTDGKCPSACICGWSGPSIKQQEPEWHENKTSKKKYYIEHGKRVNFNSSISLCKTCDGNIPEPRTKQEIDYLMSIVKDITQMFFLGLSNENEEDTWRWISDDTEPRYWLDIVGGIGDNCVVIDQQGMREWICDWIFHKAVCEKCMDGYFGVMCTNECHCKDACNRKDGKCPSACISGWSGQSCQDQDGDQP